MPTIETSWLLLLLPGYLLILARVLGLIIFAPFFGSRVIPLRFRLALAVLVALALFWMLGGKVASISNPSDFVVALLGEVFVGLVIGFGAALIFVGIRLAGLILGQQIGISLADVFDPSLEGRASILGRLFFMLTLVLFLLFGGHRALIGSLVGSFGSIAPGTFTLASLNLSTLSGLLSDAYLLAIRFVAPALVAVFLATVTLSFIGRTIRQFNLISVGFPVQISTATLVLIISLGSMCLAFESSLTGVFKSLTRLFVS